MGRSNLASKITSSKPGMLPRNDGAIGLLRHCFGSLPRNDDCMKWDAHRKHSRRGFSLVEIIGVLVIIALLAALVIPRIPGWIHRAQEAEAFNNLGAIRRAELLMHQLSGSFVDAPDHPAIESILDLVVGARVYRYMVVNATAEDFLALAIPVWPYSEWLKTVSMRKDGFVSGVPFGGAQRAPREGSGDGDSGDGSGTDSGGSGNGSGGGGGFGEGGDGGELPPTVPGQIPGFGSEIPVDPVTPTGVELTSNDGWIAIGWDDVLQPPGTFYGISEAESEDGPFTPVQGTRGSSWAFQVPNGQRRCYRVQAFTESKQSGDSRIVCAAAAPNSVFTETLNAVKNLLGGSTEPIRNVDGVTSGSQLAQILSDDHVPILFGTGSDTALAWEQGRVNDPINIGVITINIGLMGSPGSMAAEIVTAVLAHEAVHYVWWKDYRPYYINATPDPALGVPPGGGIRSDNSIDQEYRSGIAGSTVWREIRSNVDYNSLGAVGQSNYQSLDEWAKLALDMTEADGKQRLRGFGSYATLNDY